MRHLLQIARGTLLTKWEDMHPIARSMRRSPNPLNSADAAGDINRSSSGFWHDFSGRKTGRLASLEGVVSVGPGVPAPGPGGSAALCGRFGYASATAQGWSV